MPLPMEEVLGLVVGPDRPHRARRCVLDVDAALTMTSRSSSASSYCPERAQVGVQDASTSGAGSMKPSPRLRHLDQARQRCQSLLAPAVAASARSMGRPTFRATTGVVGRGAAEPARIRSDLCRAVHQYECFTVDPPYPLALPSHSACRGEIENDGGMLVDPRVATRRELTLQFEETRLSEVTEARVVVAASLLSK